MDFVAKMTLIWVVTIVMGLILPGYAASSPQQVMFVGNNWDGTITIINATGQYERIGQLNAIPDKDERMAAIQADPRKRFFFYFFQQKVGEGNNQYVDDMYSNLNGTSLIISRPSFGDVISMDISTGDINWRFPVDGYRSDHMALSPDGKQVAVSATTGNLVHLIDIETGTEIARFPTGTSPHENKYLQGGEVVINAAIGYVFTRLDSPWMKWTKGKKLLTWYDRIQNKVTKTVDMRPRLNAAGRRDLSSSIRPYQFSPDEKTMYFQVSFFNGYVAYDVNNDNITKIVTLPEGAAPRNKRDYVLDSRHHGLAINREGTKLCVCGTMDEYAAIVDLASATAQVLVPAGKPYWATESADGAHCIISESANDTVTVLDFETGIKVLSTPVGRHPQRVRAGYIPAGWTQP